MVPDAVIITGFEFFKKGSIENENPNMIIVNNKTKWVREKAEIEFNKKGNAIKALGVTQDITSKKLTENQLIKAKEKAEESDQLKTEFINNMSHEIRTPMNGIIGYSNFLDKPNLTVSKRKQYVNIIQNTTPLGFDSSMKPIIGLAHYTVLSENLTLPQTVSAKLLNSKGEYETKYYNNLSQKLLIDGITNRERDVIRLLILDYSSKEIAEKLFISSKTVDTHRRNILKKLNISSTGELVGILKLNKNLI